ncbi:hypothetical protein [Dyadobacter sp. NIV53]|uniref:hypothetical protein n=1 Tax=Dyadobacter sp. NIV53 TaxID=2861765 RepID=UPI001C87ADA8|nr:hypothetical protein [Dyadobacter sp. NIV53]
MSRKNIRYAILFLIGAVITYIVFDSTSQPNVNDLKGGFKEVALYRNENNTGPITRIYAVTATETLWDEMKKYGDLMPYTKYGTTKVYFFQAANSAPDKLVAGEVNFEKSFNQNCIGVYLKDANGQVSLTREPFK